MPRARSAAPAKASRYKSSPRLDGKDPYTRRTPQPWPDGLVWVNTEQAAAYLGIHPEALKRKRLSGDGPKYTDRIGIAYKREWLDAYMESGAKTSTSEKKDGE
jgi:hypothetical protein